MSGSTGKGRLYRVRRYGNLRGRLGLPDVESAARIVANDTFWGGFPPPATEIPYGWLTPPARFRSDQPRNLAQIARTGGATARAVSASSVAAVGERPFTATLDTAVVADPQAYATWIVGNYTNPRQRQPQLRLNLAARTPTECWRILEREIGDHIRVSGAPGESVVLNINPYFDAGITDWTGQSGATLSQSTTFTHNGTGSMAITPPGAVATVGAATAAYAVLPSTPYIAAAWLFSAAGWSDARTVIDWFGPAGFISTGGLGSPIAVPAGVWTLFSQTITSPSSATGASLRVRQGSTPSSGDVLYVDDATLTGPDGSRPPWPAGVTDLVIEGILPAIDSEGTRWVVWNTAPLIGSTPGQAGPWFRADESRTDTGSDLLAF